MRSYRLSSLARALYEPDDGRYGDWSKEELEAMNSRFVAALEQAFLSGQEHRESAAGQVALPASSGPRLSAPLYPATWSGLLRSTAAGGTVFVARE
jgi:hypothetical protein